MLRHSYEELDSANRIMLVQDSTSLVILQTLATAELKSVEESLCSLSPGPNLNVEYAITQQRRICLVDLIEFFKTLIEESTAGE